MSVRPRSGQAIPAGSGFGGRLQSELFNTQILEASSPEYREFVMTGVMSGEEAALTRALVAFCHTQLAHAQPDRFDWEEVQGAIHANPALVAQFVALFRLKFSPPDRDAAFATMRAGAKASRATTPATPISTTSAASCSAAACRLSITC
jgi:glutamate dehydrogenase